MNAKWITPTPSLNKTALYAFKKIFTVKSNVKSFYVRISADTRYRLYINGKELAHGPCQSTKHVKFYEELECAETLIRGENEIRILLLHVDPREGYKFTTAYHREQAALYFDGTLVTDEGEEKIISDESFSVFYAKHISFTHHEYCMPSLAPFEILNGDEDFEQLRCGVLYIPDEKNRYHSVWGVKEIYMLKKRPIQLLKINQKSPVRQACEYYDSEGRYNIILDAGIYTTAMLRYEFRAPEGTKINLIYSECPLTRAEDGTLYKGMRDNIYGVIEYGKPDYDHYDEIYASGSAQAYEPFFYRAYRFIRVECSEKPEYFYASSARYTYDFEKDTINGGIGSFECSDKKYSKLWEVSRNTLECCTHETFADCPYYEQQQYVGDGRFESIYVWRMSNDSLMQKKLIIDTVESLQPDGMVASTSPNMWVQVLPIASFYFINLIREYLRFTGDSRFVKSLIGVIGCSIEYFENTKNVDGLINPPDGCRFIDWVKSWTYGNVGGIPKGGDESPITVNNLMYAAMLKDAAEICDACEYNGLASDYRRMHANIVNAVNDHCYNEEVGLYIDVPGEKTYSEHTAVWAIIAEAVTGKDAYNLAERMMNCSFIAKSSFSKAYDLLRALEKVGCYEKYAPEILKQWDIMLDKHCTTWGESVSFPRSECHGWSCVPMYEMSAMILGVSPLENGYTKVKIKPVTMGLTYAKGRIPTPYGYIDVSWTLDNEIFSLEIDSSAKVEMEIILPSGKAISVSTNHYTISD